MNMATRDGVWSFDILIALRNNRLGEGIWPDVTLFSAVILINLLCSALPGPVTRDLFTCFLLCDSLCSRLAPSKDQHIASGFKPCGET